MKRRESVSLRQTWISAVAGVFLLIGLECRPVLAASSVAPPPDWKVRWEKTLAAAKQEGKLVINIQPGQVFREWVTHFEKKYPEIRLESAALFGAAFVSRVLPERRAGQYLWDIHIGGPESAQGQLVPAGALDPLKPALLLPEVLDDSKWLGGFDGGFTDKEEKYVYSMIGDVGYLAAVNRDFVSPAELNRVEDLADPKWAGKVSSYDPRIEGKGASDAGHWVMVKGAEWWRQLLAQRPVTTKDRRQQVEWLVRGQYPIAISPDTTTQTEFKRQGLGLNVKDLAPESEMGHRLSMSFVSVLINRAPHPNAARVFLNWVLSREAQERYVKLADRNSRRLDVTKLPDTAPDPKVTYRSINQEKYVHHQRIAQKIAQELLR